MIPAPTKYADLKGRTDPSTPLRTDLVYDAICRTLSDRQEQVNWTTFTRDEWGLFVQMAEAEGVGPLLYWKAKNQQSVVSGQQTAISSLKSIWPPQVFQALQASYYKTAAHNALLFRELERVLAAFAAAGIPVIVLKGAVLAQTIYPDPGLRPMGNLDLLVNRDQIELAVAILKHQEYAEMLGVSDYIHKPFTMDRLLDSVQKLIG